MTSHPSAAAIAEDSEHPPRVVVELTRRDLFFPALRIQLGMKPRKFFFALAYAYVVWAQWNGAYPPRDWVIGSILLVLFFVILLAFYLLLGAIGAWATVFYAARTPGLLSRHTFEIRPEGLFESTPANETLQKWAALHSVERRGKYILIRLSPLVFHIVPARAFSSEAACDAFYQALQQQIAAAAKPAMAENA